MSYCRMSEGDVYMYWSITGGIICCGCSFSRDASPVFFSRSEAITHLELHIEKGDIVPDRAIERLKKEIAEVGETWGLS